MAWLRNNEDVLATLARGTLLDPYRDAWQPVRFDLGSDGDRESLARLLATGQVAVVHDTIRRQIEELVARRDPTRKLTRFELDAKVDAHLAGRDEASYGAWIWFSWSRRLAHVLPCDEYREVRSDRNRFKITDAEQRRLAAARIGIVGLSVGNAAAVTLALEGVGGFYRIADFDELSLSNLNRLRAGVTDLGVEKTVLAARAMFEIDPYVEIDAMRGGVEQHTLDRFLLEGGPLDLVVEESDDLFTKLLLRERARELRIPVIMDTSDRGLLDVERFDREPDRPAFHGLLGEVAAGSLRGLSTRDKVPYVLALLGGERMSTRLAASLPEVNESIGSWPQLASAVALGGALVADTARRILLDELVESGRFYVDIESVVRDGAAELRQPVAPPPAREIAPEALRAVDVGPVPARPSSDDRATIRWLVAHALLAPSAHNAQPYSFVHRGSRLELRHDPSHDLPSLDFEHGATWVAFGAAAENIDLAARSVGLEPAFEAFPDDRDPLCVARLSFARTEPVESELVSWIVRRVTNRRLGARCPLPDDAAGALCGEADRRGARLQLLEAPRALDEMGALVGAADRIALLHRGMHADTIGGLRWTRAEVEAHRDGIDVTTMELSDADRAGLELLRQWPIALRLKQLGGGKALESTARKAIGAASAVGLITVPGTTRTSYLNAGRAVQRVWLEAARRGLAVQPMTALPYLFARIERGAAEGLDEGEVRELCALRVRYRGLFEATSDRAEAFLFRIALADAPTARALRRRVDQVLRFE